MNVGERMVRVQWNNSYYTLYRRHLRSMNNDCMGLTSLDSRRLGVSIKELSKMSNINAVFGVTIFESVILEIVTI